MADNLTLTITADTTNLRSHMAMAQADVRAYGGSVRSLASELRTASAEMKSGLLAQLNAQSAALNRATADVALRQGVEGRAQPGWG